MPTQTDHLALKRRLSRRVLGIQGVSGIGVPGGCLTIYLEVDDPEVRRRVCQVVARAAPRAIPRFEVTGPIRKR